MDNIFQINKNKQEDTYEYLYFTILGEHSSYDDEGNPLCKDKKKAYAYKRVNSVDNSETYFIKTGSHGKIFNPMGLYSEGKANKFLAKIGKTEYTFSKVNQKVFDMYLNFLRTKNTAWLNNAEREYR